MLGIFSRVTFSFAPILYLIQMGFIVSNRRIMLFVICVIFGLVGQKAFANQVTLWGTNHVGPLGIGDKCAVQNELILDHIDLDDNFIFAPEMVWSKSYSPYLVSIDDSILHNYSALLAITDDFVNLIRLNENAGNLKTLNSIQAQFFSRMNLTPETAPALLGFPKDTVTKANLENTVIPNYIAYMRAVAQKYFDSKIKNKEKYNVSLKKLGYPNSGDDVFSYATPSKLYKIENFSQDSNGVHKTSAYNVVAVYWRDYFMANNIVTLVQQKPNSNILIWFGDAHMPGITKLLVKSTELSNSQKDYIRVISTTNDRTTACDYNEVLENLNTNKAIPFQQWYRRYSSVVPNHKS